MEHLQNFSTVVRVVFIFTISFFASPHSSYAEGIELHAHLFMKEGMTWAFQGGFNDPLQAKDWKARFSSEANPEALEKSNLDIVVATLYAHPLLTRSLRDSIRTQMTQAHHFVETHPNWILATQPNEARQALQAGKHVIILALEGASGILDSDEDLKEFVDRGGIRIVNLLHLTDDEYGGVAFLRGPRILGSPVAFLKSLFGPTYDSIGTRVNDNGLTPLGSDMAMSLIKHHVWLDLAHASDSSQAQLMPLLKKFNQPLLYTHTVLRRYYRAERAISDSQLEELAASRGMVGLIPSEEMLEGTAIAGECETGGIHALAKQFTEIAQVIGEQFIAMGSDFNGGLNHLKPSCNTRTSLDQDGFWNIGQSEILWQALANLGAWHPSNPSNPSNSSNSSNPSISGPSSPSARPSTSSTITSHERAERFLKTWERVWSIRGE